MTDLFSAALESTSIDEGVPLDPDLTTVVETNEDGLAKLMHLYARPGQTVIDPTWGKGTFWKRIDTTAYDFKGTDLGQDGTDFTALPYDNESVDVMVLDPPYRYTPAANVKHGANGRSHGEVDGLYGLQASAPTRTQGVMDLYRAGMTEAHRVLRVGGILILKCQDTVQDGRNIWVHCTLMADAERMGFAVRDLMIVAPRSVTRSRWTRQRHLRKGHSYFLVCRNGGHFPFGIPSMEAR